MKIVNETRYRTADLRAVIVRVARDEADAPTRRRLHITIRYRRGRETHANGNAYVGTPAFPGTIRLFVSRHGIHVPDFALTVAHEIAHARGTTHRDMLGSRRWTYLDGWREHYAWAEGMTIAVVEPKAKPKPTIDGRLAHARALHKAALTRLRRAQTIEEKWRRRVRDLERRTGPATAEPGHAEVRVASPVPPGDS